MHLHRNAIRQNILHPPPQKPTLKLYKQATNQSQQTGAWEGLTFGELHKAFSDTKEEGER